MWSPKCGISSSQDAVRPDASVDHAMLFNILHVEEPVGLLCEAMRVLVPGGKAGIIHWRTDLETPRGPSMADPPMPGTVPGLG